MLFDLSSELIGIKARHGLRYFLSRTDSQDRIMVGKWWWLRGRTEREGFIFWRSRANIDRDEWYEEVAKYILEWLPFEKHLQEEVNPYKLGK